MIDVIQRYRPVVQIIGKSSTNKTRILEIGSSSYGIARFLKRDIIGLDVQFQDENEIAENLTPVLGSACCLPFKDRCFDIVASIHMLEHITSENRNIAISEMLRVSKKTIVFSVPCGKKSALYEKKLRGFHSIFFKNRGWLMEHEEFGLPEKTELLEEIHHSKKDVVIEVAGDVNLSVWLVTMIIQLPLDTLFWKYAPEGRNAILKKLMILTGWVMPIFNFGNTYSQVFIIDIK